MLKGNHKRAFRTPTYIRAIEWIAMNDDRQSDASVEDLGTYYTSVRLVANMFCASVKDVARDVYLYRHPDAEVPR